MKLLMRCEHVLAAAHCAGALRAAGIECEVRNTVLSGALGEIPFIECAPQVWLRHAGDEARAREVIARLAEPEHGATWTCTRCGERLEPQFAQCWACGADRPQRDA